MNSAIVLAGVSISGRARHDRLGRSCVRPPGTLGRHRRPPSVVINMLDPMWSPLKPALQGRVPGTSPKTRRIHAVPAVGAERNIGKHVRS